MRYGLISDIHSNLPALEAVLEALEGYEPIDSLICMGDIVGYGPQPNEVIERLKQYKLTAIVGNHDLAVIGTLNLDDFNSDAIKSNRWNGEQLSEENREWLTQLKPITNFDDKVTLAHGSPREPIWEYLTTPQAAAINFPQFDTQLCFVGHTHLPRVFRSKGSAVAGPKGLTVSRLLKGSLHPRVEMIIPQAGQVIELGESKAIINPGSVGQPRDGDSRASFAIYDDVAMTITFERAEYDISLTQFLMREVDLPNRLILRLDFGL